MDNTCTPMDQDAFENAAASLRFRFNPSFQTKWDSKVMITEGGKVIIKDEVFFNDLITMPLEKLHGNAIVVEMEDEAGRLRELSSARWVLTSLGLHPTVEDDLLVERHVDVSGVLLAIANDSCEHEVSGGVERYYPGGVNPAKVIYALKILEHVAVHSTEVNFYGCDIKAGEEDVAYTEAIVPARGHMAIHKLSQHLSPVSGEGQFQSSSIFMHAVGIYVLKDIFLSLKAMIRPEVFNRRFEVFSLEPIVAKENLIINPRTELLHTMAGHNLLEALAHCTESKYGTEKLAEMIVLSIASELACIPDTEGPIQLILGTQAMPFGVPTIGRALPERSNGSGARYEAMVHYFERMYHGIYELFSLPPVLPYMGFSMLEAPDGIRVVGDRPIIIPVPNLEEGDIRRISIDFLGKTGSKFAVGGLVLAFANLVAPFMDVDTAKVPPSIRKYKSILFDNIAAASDRCGLPGNALGAALMYPDSLYDDGKISEALLDPRTFNAIAPLIVSAQVRAMGIREDLGVCDGNGHSSQPLRVLVKDLLTVARRQALMGSDNSESARFARMRAGLQSPCIEHVMRATGLKREIHEIVLTLGDLSIRSQRASLKQESPKPRAWLLQGRV